MKVDKKAKFIIFFTIAILALGLSNIASALTGDLVSTSLPVANETDKLMALDNDNFSPASLNALYEEKPVVEEVNETADTNDTDSAESDSQTSTETTEKEPADNSNGNTNNNQNPGSSESQSSNSNGQNEGSDD